MFSYPEYLYEQSKQKRRFVVGGSHGKTSITAMILHVLNFHQVDFDYMVGSQLEGFDRMVRLSESAPIIILEGDEYLSSPIDRRPKFHLYKADVALLSGIAWDHINVFPTFDNYVEQFRIYVNGIPENGRLIYCDQDPEVKTVGEAASPVKNKSPYGIPKHRIVDGTTILETAQGDVPLQIFGTHNLMNLEGARMMCNEAGISDAQFYEAIGSFKGAARRLELIARTEKLIVFKDFAHSPSKLKATTDAVKTQFSERRLVACMELHTFSSLNAAFLDEYKDAMKLADIAVVYFNPQTIADKKLEAISTEQVKKAFGREDLIVMNASAEVRSFLENQVYKRDVLLLMSSGNFDGIDLNTFGKALAEK